MKYLRTASADLHPDLLFLALSYQTDDVIIFILRGDRCRFCRFFWFVSLTKATE
jgi:hypothetical protein